ncbi:hypothetical protein KR009_010352 [Drosophila setifemur]|nr:hypothetical protein KR009_010352 [Drosophila setifemur]
MLTSAREWELKGSNRLPAMLLLCWCLLLLPGLVLLGDGASVTWGHVNKYASQLYTEDVYLTPGTPGRDLIYGSQNASDNYRITGIHVEDLGALAEAEAFVTRGGIGQEFVVVRCQRKLVDKKLDTAHLQVSIYGLDL